MYKSVPVCTSVYKYVPVCTSLQELCCFSITICAGGSALWMAALMEVINPKCKIVTIDPNGIEHWNSHWSVTSGIESKDPSLHPLWHKRVTAIKGSTTQPAVIAKVSVTTPLLPCDQFVRAGGARVCGLCNKGISAAELRPLTRDSAARAQRLFEIRDPRQLCDSRSHLVRISAISDRRVLIGK